MGVRPDPPGICTADLYPVFSPRGGRIAFVRSTLETAEIWVMNADGSNPRPLTTGAEMVLSSAPIDWSPDGRKIAFLANPPDHINGELYVMSADGTGLRQLTATPTDGENGGVAWPGPELEHLGLASRPTDPPNACIRRALLEEDVLCCSQLESSGFRTHRSYSGGVWPLPGSAPST